MLTIKKLKKPSYKSGFELKLDERTKQRGILMVNQTRGTKWEGSVHVDKFTQRKRIRKKK